MCTEVGEKMSEKEIVFCKSGGCTAKLGAGVLEHIWNGFRKEKTMKICWLDMTARMMQQYIA